MALMCRDELEERNIPMRTVNDWMAVHHLGRSQSEVITRPTSSSSAPGAMVTTANSPIRLQRSSSRRRSQTHKLVEFPNPKFGTEGLTCGEKGYLRADSLDNWFKEFGRPIAINMDVKRYAGALLQKAKDMSGDRRVKAITQSPARRRIERKAAEAKQLLHELQLREKDQTIKAPNSRTKTSRAPYAAAVSLNEGKSLSLAEAVS
eukprot:TRINITY_DN14760_c0_g1_i1.p1 TRINITY_DN14760_c0_g1~~TRINITY_DN14760_c0_g1_i1.p1  ORF type:complete len:205 (-),score=36.45 TRINITY_DN14760_c0_g1_i1:13-627(-)